MNLFENIKHIAKTEEEAIVMFSTGMDSVVMLDLFQRFMPGRYTAVHLYYCKGLSFTDKVIKHYEKRYGIEVKQHPHPLSVYYMPSYQLKRKKKPSLSDVEKWLRQLYKIDKVAYGYMKCDSLERRGMLALKNQKGEILGEKGVNYKHHKMYPIAEWKKRDVSRYINKEKLILPETYSLGYRDITTFTGEEVMLMLYNNYHEDYLKVIETYPILEAERIKEMQNL